MQVIEDSDDPRRIIVGRTGSGKTALLTKIVEEDKVISVSPDSLALEYISNSTILKFLSQIGVKLDIFFRLLWRHVFTVEILKKHFQIYNEKSKNDFVERVKKLFRSEKNAKALDYLEKWGKSFWEETEYRIKEVTTKLEEDLKASISSILPALSLGVENASRLSEEQKQEVIKRAQTVVNEVQIRELSAIIDLIRDILTDSKKKYHVIIDRLDEDWIEENLRYRLIRALIETVRDFKKVRHVKIIVALRVDLLDRVFRQTRDSGFQEEKYESLYLNLNWTKEHLIDVLNARINFLVKQRYTKQQVTYRDILPKSVDQQLTIDYILERTLMRPRDVILFFNRCIALAIDRPSITAKMIKEAEGEYSRMRLRSLADEWTSDYPKLIDFATALLKKRSKSFTIAEITKDEIEEFCLKFVIENPQEKDSFSLMAREVVDSALLTEDFRKSIIRTFYRVGLVGLKLERHEAVSWSTKRPTISEAELNSNVKVYIHPCFWRILGIKED